MASLQPSSCPLWLGQSCETELATSGKGSNSHNPTLLPTTGCSQIQAVVPPVFDPYLFVACRGRVQPLRCTRRESIAIYCGGKITLSDSISKGGLTFGRASA